MMSDLTLLIQRLKDDLAESKEKSLERFAASVIAVERERCAKVCEEFYSVENVAQKCAEAIRKGE